METLISGDEMAETTSAVIDELRESAQYFGDVASYVADFHERGIYMDEVARLKALIEKLAGLVNTEPSNGIMEPGGVNIIGDQ